MPIKHQCQLVLYRRAQAAPNNDWAHEWSRNSSSTKAKKANKKSACCHHNHNDTQSHTHIDLSRGVFIRSRSQSNSTDRRCCSSSRSSSSHSSRASSIFSSGSEEEEGGSDSDNDEAQEAHRAAYRELLTPRLLPSSVEEMVRNKARECAAVKTIEYRPRSDRDRDANAVLGLTPRRRAPAPREPEIITVEKPMVVTVTPQRPALREEILYVR